MMTSLGQEKPNEQVPLVRWNVLCWLIVLGLLAFAMVQLFGSSLTIDSVTSPGFNHAGSDDPTAPWSRIRIKGDKQFMWASGRRTEDMSSAQWFDMTRSPILLRGINHGIGKDTIAAIDDPVFVSPDDPKLLMRWGLDSRDELLTKLDVIGYVFKDDARAYPIALLNRHELVNDVVGGKPVTVGW